MSNPTNKNEPIDKLGKKLRTLRTGRGLTVRQLGDILGVNHSHITKIEKGENIPSIPLALKIANLFDISIDQLVRDDLSVN